ncbi:polyketide synthase type I [Streptomyces davaonensis JCM 4913]|uniref:Polyketide synthase type I n=1 Tax=Streptomyces davaonensis (strain DSM 101723 / JCM 4913 / KCC S-0913 / 768) TaxID=1214101 RepID=K4QTR6_STRDJ|nr:type I polyketide synthase [Streptomyces davaonensis]CCK26866.1 polyketide synthase type I [Streptomyces davaonensis JCM 4913]
MAENRRFEPRPDDIAVVGAGCRFPGGVRDLDGLWRVLMDGVDVVAPVPADRWSDEFHHPDRHNPGTTYCREGGFLDEIDRFDADYFGVSPREARGMDPQQRLLLEVCSEAMEDAGLPRGAWEGSRTSVHMGILGSDYLLLHARTSGIRAIDPYFASGKEFSFAAGRIAYTFGLHGPAMTVNTACSSSLVAVHLACQALRNGEADAALAGGVNVIVAPELSVFMGKVQALSPTGRCRPFDARADGIVRGEGCGVVVLKRYADAVRDHDRIHGLIRGSAVNQDGRSAGLTAPNAVAQQDLLRAALASASVTPEEPVFVEAHGTGTPLGDPLEISALTEVIGRTRSAESPLLVGSHKAHFGHMDSAAGIAGLLKTLLVLRHRTVPGQIHHVYPAPMIDWESSGTLVPVEHVRLPGEDRSLTAGVSAFGLSGTNAHVVLGSAPEPAATEPAADSVAGPHTLLVSATTADGLRALAADYAARLADPVGPLAAASAVRRTQLKHRIAVVGKDAAELTAALADAEGSRAADNPPKLVHVFSGQGSQWPKMGLDLAQSEPVVRDTLDDIDELLRAEAGWSLYDVLRDADPARVKATDVAQPAVFAVQVALARLWQSWGVRPDAVIGHSMGEVAAAHMAGALELEDAVRLVTHRGRLMHAAAGTGRMANVELGADQVAERLAARHPEVCVATENGPASVVIAGPKEAVEAAVRELADDGVNVVALPVDYAFHSPLMQPYADELASVLADLTPSAPTVPFLSTALPGQDVPLDAAYWSANIREAVRLWPVVDTLLAQGETAFVEIGAHPVLARPLQSSLAHRERRGPVVSSLVRGQNGPTMLARSRAKLHEAGVEVDWATAHGAPVRPVSLPPHRWADERFWLDGVERGEQGSGPSDLSGLRAEVRLVDASGKVVAELSADRPEAEAPASAPATVAPAPAVVASVAPEEPVEESASVSYDREHVASTVHSVLIKILGHGPRKRLPRTRGFFELGVDSISVAEFGRMVAEKLRVPVDGADALAHGTIDGFTDYIMTLTPEGSEESATTGDPVPAAPSGPVAQFPAPLGGAAEPVVEDVPEVPVAPIASSEPAVPAPESDDAVEPIAVIGIGCRLPGGVSGPSDFWRLLDERVDASGSVPAERWNAAALDGVPTRGSFLGEIDGFDNSFFRISPREARTMDPQQRLFLEVAWEALEDAGVRADRMSGSRTGVFVGLNTTDYQQLVTRSQSDVDLYYGTGNSFSATSGRISYFLGLRGPSLAVDTACSSSLTAVHLACQSLRAGESKLALAGGVNVMATPTVFLSMGAAGALAPDGRCKTFDDSADGYGRGEGAGVVILKKLSTALRDGDRVYAIIRGSAVNQDGASGGFTVPSGTAQEEVILSALDQAGIEPHEVSYVEAHGTGTRLGDAVELRALAGALGAGRPGDRPLVVGSVKTNVGHLEAAAGVTGLIKTVLALGRERIPAQLHLSEPTSQLDWQKLPLAVAGEPVPWPRGERPRIAGISAFGFTGTNAHVLVQEAPEQPATPAATGPARPCVLTVSAATPDALTAAVALMRERVAATPDAELADLCWTSGARRSHLAHRVTAVGRTREELLAALDRARPVQARDEAAVLFVFGRTPADMSGYEEALAGDPEAAELYRAALAEAREALRAELGESDGPALPGSVEHAGEVFAGQLATTALWKAFGVEPDAVVGWDIGEYAAAVVAGDLTLLNAVRLLAAGVPVPAQPDGARVARHSAANGWSGLANEVIMSGIDVLLDIGTGSRAIRMLGAALDAAVEPGETIPVQLTAPRKRQPSGVEKAYLGPVDLLELAAGLHAHGADVDWDRLVPGPHRPVTLPAYPWQRKPYWVDTPYAVEPRPQSEPQPAAETAPEPAGDLATELLALPPDRRAERLVDLLLRLVAQVLGEEADVSPDQGFFDLGMDSVLSQDLKQRAERELGLELPGTVMFECPNVTSFARFVLDEVLTEPQDQAEPAATAAAQEPAADLEDPADLDDDDLLSRLDDALASSEALLTEGD